MSEKAKKDEKIKEKAPLENTSETITEETKEVNSSNKDPKAEVVDAETEEKVAEEEKKEEIDRKNQFRVGDTVKVFYRIIEGGKERIQPYEGTVITKKGSGISKTFTVRRIGMANIGVERIFPIYSPKISEIQVVRKGKARRAKLYYLRDAVSKRDAKIKERV